MFYTYMNSLYFYIFIYYKIKRKKVLRFNYLTVKINYKRKNTLNEEFLNLLKHISLSFLRSILI
jgi:hypothetical protein